MDTLLSALQLGAGPTSHPGAPTGPLAGWSGPAALRWRRGPRDWRAAWAPTTHTPLPTEHPTVAFCEVPGKRQGHKACRRLPRSSGLGCLTTPESQKPEVKARGVVQGAGLLPGAQGRGLELRKHF